jgi:para-nitrobenzyl esterase
MGGTYGPEDATLSQQMQTYWTNFAKTGNPNGSGLPNWPAFAGSEPALMHFTPQGSAEASPGAPRETCVLLKTHIEQELQAGH